MNDLDLNIMTDYGLKLKTDLSLNIRLLENYCYLCML